MLTNTFIHILGIGAITEQRLWDSGFRDWESFSKDLPIPIPTGRKYFLEKGIEHHFNIRLDHAHIDLRYIFYKFHVIEEPTLPGNPFSADLGTVDKIKNSSQDWLLGQWH